MVGAADAEEDEGSEEALAPAERRTKPKREEVRGS